MKLLIRIFGDGVELKKLKEYKHQNKVNNVEFHNKLPSSKIYKEYKKANALYLSLAKNKFLNFTIPAKLQTYFSLSKPIIASASGETKKIIHQSKAGYCSNPEDIPALTKNILKILNNKNAKIKSFEKNSKKYFLNNFDRGLIVSKLNKILRD